MKPSDRGAPRKFLDLTLLTLGYLALLSALIFGVWNLGHRFDPDFRSPFDEHTHFDYWWKIYHEHRLPAVYEKIDKASLQIWDCKDGEQTFQRNACTGTKQGPSIHENTASNYAPTFYMASAGMSALINGLHPTQDLFHLAKLSTLTWGMLCLLALAVTSAMLGIPPLMNALLVFAIAQTPAFVFASITFNQEIFVLLCTLLGLMIYIRLQQEHASFRFAAIAGVWAAFCLSIKPTALLFPVIIVTAELLSTHRPLKIRLTRIVSFSAISLGLYAMFTISINAFRGVHASDGLMGESLRQRFEGADRGWLAMTEMVWAHFTRSTGSLHWRHLVDWDLPWLFLHFHWFVLIMLALAVVVFFLQWRIRTEPLLSARLFIGSMAAFVVLPLALAAYLSGSDFPFFFQPRYFTAYIIVGVMMGTALLTDLFRISATAVCREHPSQKETA